MDMTLQIYKRMRNKIAFLVLVATLFSCKNDQLADSYIYFDEPQPDGVESITSFPKKHQNQTFKLSKNICSQNQIRS